jgi:hypothetical protein
MSNTIYIDSIEVLLSNRILEDNSNTLKNIVSSENHMLPPSCPKAQKIKILQAASPYPHQNMSYAALHDFT